MFYVCSIMELHIIWFRNDLRVHDNAALATACATGGPVLPLYIFEPEAWQAPEVSGRQFGFLVESLADLDSALRKRGSELCLKTGSPVDILSRLHVEHGIASLHFEATASSPREAERDRKVRKWALGAGIPIRAQDTSIRYSPAGVPESDDAAWLTSMRQTRLMAPDAIQPCSVRSSPWPAASDFGLAEDICPKRQTGGRTNAVLLLRRFFAGDGRTYGKPGLNIPNTPSAGLYLWAHLAHGTLSEREVWQGAWNAHRALKEDGDQTFSASLERFTDHLRVRAQIVQHASVHALHAGESLTPPDTLNRPHVPSGDPRFRAWISGHTGFPLLDAGMRCLQATGTLDTRLRELLLSFALCHLWMAPPDPVGHMARLLIDFTPACFAASIRKVTGMTAKGATYVPNPVRHSLALDPDGEFIRTWVPEIAALPDKYIHCPWDAPKAFLAQEDIILGQTYPMRIVDHIAAAREARNRLGPPAVTHSLPFRKGIVPKRMVSRAAKSAPPRPQTASAQLSLDL